MERKGKVDPKWFPVTHEELSAYIGIHIIMGIHTLPRITNYWSNDDSLSVQSVKRTMPRERFDKIMQYFCISDRRNEPGKNSPVYDKLYKIKPLLSMLETSYLVNYKPGCEISIDEAMVKFKGRIGFLQYLPMKPVKRGIKVWMASEPVHGYTLQCVVYTGKNDKSKTGICSSGKGLGYDVVMNLAKHFFYKNHHIYFDNYFNSYQLLQDLLKKKTYACGTFRQNRKYFPKDLKAAKLKQNESLMRQNQEFISCVWRDRGKTQQEYRKRYIIRP